MRENIDGAVHKDIPISGRRRIRGNSDICGEQTIGKGRGSNAIRGQCAGSCTDREINRVNKPCASITKRCQSGDYGSINNGEFSAGGFNKTTTASVWSGCIKRAAYGCLAVVHVGDDHNATALFLDGASLNEPDIFGTRHPQGIGGLCGQNNHSAVGLDDALVFHESVYGSPIDRVADKPVTVEVKGYLIACGKESVATVGGNAPFVGNFGGQ